MHRVPDPPKPAALDSGSRILDTLRSLGATRLQGVTFRANRSRIWSLTRGATHMNLHRAFASAPPEIVAHLACIAREPYRPSGRYGKACRAVACWPPLLEDLRGLRRRARCAPGGEGRSSLEPGPCCATGPQLEYLRRLYLRLNRSRFDDRLPPDLPLRLSNRMRSRLGQVVPGLRNGRRIVVEIALNVDLMLEANDAARLDTLLHEMAHAADYLLEGGRGHGPSWRRWARRVGCEPRACTRQVIARRPRGVTTVTRVPPWERVEGDGPVGSRQADPTPDRGAVPPPPPTPRDGVRPAARSTRDPETPDPPI